MLNLLVILLILLFGYLIIHIAYFITYIEFVKNKKDFWELIIPFYFIIKFYKKLK